LAQLLGTEEDDGLLPGVVAIDKLGVTGSSPVPPIRKGLLSGPFCFLARRWSLPQCLVGACVCRAQTMDGTRHVGARLERSSPKFALSSSGLEPPRCSPTMSHSAGGTMVSRFESHFALAGATPQWRRRSSTTAHVRRLTAFKAAAEHSAKAPFLSAGTRARGSPPTSLPIRAWMCASRRLPTGTSGFEAARSMSGVSRLREAAAP
jgi:hypothetical protein